MGEKTFSLGVPLKNKPTPAQLKELEKIYGSAVTVEKDGRGLFKAAVYNVSEDTSGTSPAPEPETENKPDTDKPEPKPENGGDPPFTGKKQIVTLDNGEKVEAKEISGGRWLASINGKWQIIEGVGGEKESAPAPSGGLLTQAAPEQVENKFTQRDERYEVDAVMSKYTDVFVDKSGIVWGKSNGQLTKIMSKPKEKLSIVSGGKKMTNPEWEQYQELLAAIK